MSGVLKYLREKNNTTFFTNEMSTFLAFYLHLKKLFMMFYTQYQQFKNSVLLYMANKRFLIQKFDAGPMSRPA